MVDTPTAPLPSAVPSTGPLAISPPTEAFGASAFGQGLSTIGQAEGQASDVLAKHALAFQAINNQNSADSTTHKWSISSDADDTQYGKDLNAKLSENPGMDTSAYLADYLQKKEAKRLSFAQDMTNPIAAQMFNTDSRRLSLLAARGLTEQTAEAWKSSATKTAEGDISNNQGIAIAGNGDLNNPAVVEALVKIKNGVDRIGLVQGIGGEALTALEREKVSPIYEELFKQAVDSNNIAGARQILSDHAPRDLTPNALGFMNGALKVANAQNAIRTPVSDIFDRHVAPSSPAVEGIDTSPRGFINAFTLRWESGQTVTDVNGAPVQYGINKQYNPDVPVGNLTRDQAADILTNRYTAPEGLSPALRNAYLDTKIMSPDVADKFLKESGGDVNKYIDLREQYQAGLAEKNPEKYGAVAAGWHNRSEDLRQFVGSQSSVTFNQPPPTFPANANPEEMRAEYKSYVERVAQSNLFSTQTQRDQFRRDADARADLEANITRERQDALYATAHGYITGGLPNGNAVHSFNDIPSTILTGLSQPYKDKLYEAVNTAAQFAGGYKTPEMTANAGRLEAMSGLDTVKFLNTDLASIPLSAPDFMQLTKLQAGLRRGDEKTVQRQEEYNALASNPYVSSLIKSTFEQDVGPNFPYGDSKPTPGGAYVPSDAHLAFLGSLKAEVEKAQAAQPNKPLSPDEVGAIARNLFINRGVSKNGVNIPSFWFVPNADRAAIVESFRKNINRDPSSDEIAYAYHRNN